MLFTHGRESYRRNSYLVTYMFYKNILYVIPIWFFGFYSNMSQTMIYNLFFYNYYNFFFTSMPIIQFASFDWEHSKEDLLKNPKFYKIGLQNDYFNNWVFWQYFSQAIAQGIIILFFTVDSLESDYTNGMSTGLEVDGAGIYTIIILLANLKVVLKSHEWNFPMFFWSVGTIILYLLCFYTLNKLTWSDLLGVFSEIFRCMTFWFLLLLFVPGTSVVEWGV